VCTILDIVVDDIEAEVERLRALGTTRIDEDVTARALC
jgi:hypothetical protein